MLFVIEYPQKHYTYIKSSFKLYRMHRYLTVKRIGQMAWKILQDCKITEPWVDVKWIAENRFGIQIEKGSFGDKICGLLINKGGKSIIGVNNNLNETRDRNRIRFTIAHELGHFALNHQRDGVFVDQGNQHFSIFLRNEKSAEGTNQQEIEANAFAAALLMPEQFLREEIHKLIFEKKMQFDLSEDDPDEKFLSSLSETFRVSRMAMTYRIGNLNLFNTM